MKPIQTAFLAAAAAVFVAIPMPAAAELWKCVTEGSPSATYTETPTFGPETKCAVVEGVTFQREGGERSAKSVSRAASKASSPSPKKTAKRTEPEPKRKASRKSSNK